MAKVLEDECCDCKSDGYPCLGNSCQNRNVIHLICDKCKEESEELYETEDGELCAECVLGMYEKVRID